MVDSPASYANTKVWVQAIGLSSMKGNTMSTTLDEIDFDDIPLVKFNVETRLPPGKTPEDWAQIDREFTYKQALNRYAKAINAC